MVALNKLLNILIFGLAIATVYFANTLHKQRTVILKDKSQLMTTVETIAGSTGRSVEGDFNTEETQKSAVDAVKAVVSQKDYLADAIVNVGKGAKIAGGTLVVDELKGTDEEVMKSRAGAIVKAAQDIAGRDKKIIERIQAWGEELGAPVNVDQLGSLEGCDKPLTDVQTALSDLKAKSNVFVDAMKGGMDNLSNYEWSFAADELTLASEFKSALNKFKADMEGISKKLASVQKLEGTIEEKNGEITELTETIEARNNEITKLQDDAVAAQKLIAKQEETIKEYTTLGTLDPNVTGEVTSVNSEFGFIVTNLGKEKIRPNVKMYIRRGEDYVASVLVSTVDKEASVAEILPELKEGTIQVGDKVIFTTTGK